MIRTHLAGLVGCVLAGNSIVCGQSTAPTIAPGGVVNSADYTSRVAPGMIVSVFGASMASKVTSAASVPLPTVLDGTSLEVNGQSIPLFFVSPKQINAQMPFDVSGQAQVRVRTPNGVSTPLAITIVSSAPKLFTKTQDGKGEPILLHGADWTLVSPASPAHPGEQLVLFLTGLGAVVPVIPAGQAGGDNAKYGPLNQVPNGTVTVNVGGKQIAPLFAGLAPGFVGLYQINFGLSADILNGTFGLIVITKSASSQAGVQIVVADIPKPNIEFVPIPAGEFMMGCSPGDDFCNSDENPRHTVRLTKSFEMSKYEVTQAQWTAVMGSYPSHFYSRSDLPVDSVSWNDVQDFLTKMNARNDGYHYRLPTEAEWEYAARAVTAGPTYGDLDAIAWDVNNSGSKTHQVGLKQPNAWGLYDMLGNLGEWCQDWYDSRYYSQGAITDPPGPSTGFYKVHRGGSWYRLGWTLRVSLRDTSAPVAGLDVKGNLVGFRCVRTR
ncbi:MAG: SUMF1/EgtB/PvdO family nonheme iron enzyme [Candidatus Solibacter sp.]